MKKRDYKELLNASVEAATPAMREDVRQAPFADASRIEESPVLTRRTRRRPSYLRAAVAACLSLVMIVAAVTAVLLNRPQGTPPATGSGLDYRSYITVDINPSFSLTVDATGKVSHVVAENYDGEVVLDSMAAKGVSLTGNYDATLGLLLGYAKALGYFKTSDGIQIDLYHYTADAVVRDDMLAHLTEVVQAIGTDAPPVNVQEMARDTVLGIAKEVFDGVTAEIDEDDLYELLAGKRGFGDTRRDHTHETDEGVCSDDIFLELTLVSYSLEALEELSECFESLESYLALRNMTKEALFREDGQFFRMMKKQVDHLLAWVGDSRTLTLETYDVLKQYSAGTVSEAHEELLEDYLDACREGEAPRYALSAEELIQAVLADANVSAVYQGLQQKYGAEAAADTFKLVTAIERSWREVSHYFESLDRFTDPDDEDDFEFDFDLDFDFDFTGGHKNEGNGSPNAEKPDR